MSESGASLTPTTGRDVNSGAVYHDESPDQARSVCISIRPMAPWVIFCDTGDEHANTYAHVADVAQFCAASAIPFVHITGDTRYHTGHWREGLVGQFQATRTVMGVTFPKSCSDQLKISPFY